MSEDKRADRWSALSDAIGRIAAAPNQDEAIAILRSTAREIVGADGVTIVRREGHETVYVAEDAISPAWEGKRFPMNECLAGFAIMQRRPVIVPDVARADNVPQNLYMSTFISSCAVFPVGLTEPVGAIGAYWHKHHDIDDDTVALIAALARALGAAIETYAVLDQSRAEQQRLRRAAG